MTHLSENKILEKLQSIENKIKVIKNDNILTLIEEEKFTSFLYGLVQFQLLLYLVII